jgi:hypothetical protein
MRAQLCVCARTHDCGITGCQHYTYTPRHRPIGYVSKCKHVLEGKRELWRPATHTEIAAARLRGWDGRG